MPLLYSAFIYMSTKILLDYNGFIAISNEGIFLVADRTDQHLVTKRFALILDTLSQRT
jgi:hypothetical protein